ncbi:hypothetical protein CRUP_007499 [Coryphaenoides rupestris]|nr:hypothetical protein CRUP_007499 [Coryphaenoides rupestris]
MVSKANMVNLWKRRQSLFPNYKVSGSAGERRSSQDSVVPFVKESYLKTWNSMQDLSRDIYDIYAEDEDDEDERLMHSPTQSPRKTT